MSPGCGYARVSEHEEDVLFVATYLHYNHDRRWATGHPTHHTTPKPPATHSPTVTCLLACLPACISLSLSLSLSHFFCVSLSVHLCTHVRTHTCTHTHIDCYVMVHVTSPTWSPTNAPLHYIPTPTPPPPIPILIFPYLSRPVIEFHGRCGLDVTLGHASKWVLLLVLSRQHCLSWADRQLSFVKTCEWSVLIRNLVCLLLLSPTVEGKADKWKDCTICTETNLLITYCMKRCEMEKIKRRHQQVIVSQWFDVPKRVQNAMKMCYYHCTPSPSHIPTHPSAQLNRRTPYNICTNVERYMYMYSYREREREKESSPVYTFSIYIYICICFCLCMYMYVHTHTRTHVCVCMHVYMYVCMNK